MEGRVNLVDFVRGGHTLSMHGTARFYLEYEPLVGRRRSTNIASFLPLIAGTNQRRARQVARSHTYLASTQ